MIARAAGGAVALALLAAGARDDPFAGRVPGTPVDCVSLFANNGPVVVDERTILLRQGADRLFRTAPAGRCPLEPLSTLVIEVYGSQLCRNDRFRVVTPGTSIPSAYCRFDRFVPYVRAR